MFKLRLVQPLLEEAPTPPYAELIKRLSFTSLSEASNALTTANRWYRNALQEVVLEYAEAESEVEDEIQELMAVVAKEE